MSIYNYKEIEKKWQENWKVEHETFDYDLKNKYYCLTMFSYPSGDKLHIGHWYNYGPVDTFARFKRMRGKSVFQPQGFDSFGLPAENFAIKNGVHPRESTMSNIGTMRKQLSEIGAMFDWSAEVVTSRPDYYRWTQWLFKELYINKLAYRREALVNWDPVDQTVLANEQVIDGKGWRSGALVERKKLNQWFFNISKFSEELLDGLKDLSEWPNKVKTMQTNWIGKSYGCEIDFKIEGDLPVKSIKCFTTRPDTLFGFSFLALSVDHEISKFFAENNEFKEFKNECSKTGTTEEAIAMGEKIGFKTNLVAKNPLNSSQKVPVYFANFVLMDYGFGAVFGCPAHDQRDFDFAKKYNLEIKTVVKPQNEDDSFSVINEAYPGSGIIINSDFLNGLEAPENSVVKTIDILEKKKLGKKLLRPDLTLAKKSKIQAPGMLDSHYAPNSNLKLNVENPTTNELFLGFGDMPKNALGLNLSQGRNLEEAAMNFFATLTDIDAMAKLMKIKTISVAPIPNLSFGIAINDRLKRAAVSKS